jgi:hypothetical protein
MVNDDMLTGADEIAAYIGHSTRATYHLLDSNKLPGVFKLGGRWHARKSRLNQHFDELERQHRQTPEAAE